MYGLPDTLRPLSAAEEQVMLAVWACPGAAARRDISQKLKAAGHPAGLRRVLYAAAAGYPV